MDMTSRDKNGLTSNNGMPDGPLHEVANGAHGIVDHMATAAGAAARTVQPAIDHAAAMGHQTVDGVLAVAEPTQAWINEKSEALMAAQRKAVSGTRQYVVAHPLQSVCIALAAGLLIGRWRR